MRIRFLILFFSILLPCQTSAAEDATGVRYRRLQKEGPSTIHVLEMDPQYARLEIALGWDTVLGRESLLSIVRRKGALAGINGGYFEVNGDADGLPIGALKVNGRWVAEPTPDRSVFGWDPKTGEAVIGRLELTTSVMIGSDHFQVDGLNRPRKANETILYTDLYHRTTLTDPGGVEVKIGQDGRVIEVLDLQGDQVIPQGGYVLSFGPEAIADYATIEDGEEVVIKFDAADPDAPQINWNQLPWLIGGTPLLVRNDRIVTDYKRERIIPSFVRFRHPRTALGIKEDGSLLLVVVDGRRLFSPGISIPDLATVMKSLGAIYALNLDGGKSSTLVIGSQVMNQPSGDSTEPHLERKQTRISNALLIYPRD